MHVRRLPIMNLALPLAFAAVSLTSCQPNSGARPKGASSPSPVKAGGTSTGGSGDTQTYAVHNHVVTDISSSSEVDLRINFNQSQSPAVDLRTLCAAGCFVRLTWEDGNNPNRQIQVAVGTGSATLQPWSVSVKLPATFKNEILPSSTITLNMLPAPGNSRTFSLAPYKFTKQSATVAGDFQDDKGRPFINLYRYSCFDRFIRGKKIHNEMQEFTLPNSSNKVPLVFGSRFCFQRATESGGVEYACQPNSFNQPDNDFFSAQSYTYNLYIRSSELGGIIHGNSRFTCPEVIPSDSQRALLQSLGHTVTDLMPYPLDSTFALATGQSTDFSVGVEAYSRLGGGQDAATRPPASCGSTAGSNAGVTELARACLGYAAKPDNAGFCPKVRVRDSRNPGVERTVQTYRLRRYVMAYPLRFNTDGRMIDNRGIDIDEVLVLDRPAEDPNLVASGMPSTIAGPKPCPQAYFDNNVTSPTSARYRGVNDPAWNGPNGLGLNVDGTRLPNTDIRDTTNGVYSCAATIAIPGRNPATNDPLFTLGTVLGNVYLNGVNGQLKHSGNPVVPMQDMHIRPQSAWTPRWEEDRDFVACAPASSGPIDAPLEIAKEPSGAGVSWCAAVQPTKNPHTNLTLTTEPLCRGGNATCPREAMIHGVEVGKTDFKFFPLAAPQADINRALKENPASYRCSITYDRLSNRLGRAPAGGCCRNGSRTITPTMGPASDHVEPDEVCAAPASL